MDLLKVNNKNNFGVLRINQIMSKLLTLSKRLQLNYWHFSSFFFWNNVRRQQLASPYKIAFKVSRQKDKFQAANLLIHQC